MTSNAIQTQGFKFEIQTAAGPPAVMTEVKEITKFQGFDGSASEIDTTNLQSDAKEVLMGLQDFGKFTMDVSHLPGDAGQIAMRAAKGNRTKQTFLCTFSDESTAAFSGYVLSNPISGGVDAKVDASFTVRITGDVTFDT
jgi:hypothetical protein